MSNVVENSIKYLPEHRVIICLECRIGVWAQEIQSHFTGPKHKRGIQEARSIEEYVKSNYPDVCGSHETFTFPADGVKEIPELPVYTDGMECDWCGQVKRTEGSIRVHVREVHRSSKYKGKGRPSVIQRAQTGPTTYVYCQRLFIGRKHSHYFKVEPRAERQANSDDAEAEGSRMWMQRITAEVVKNAEMEKRTDAAVENEESARNLWLEMTRWPEYLRGCERMKLMALVKRPDAEEEPAEAAIWTAIGRIARLGQQTLRNRAARELRLEAMREEMATKPKKPLMAYQDDG